MNNSRLNKQMRIALLSGIAFILMYLDFPLPIFPVFLKIDVSDIPALIGAFSLGPVAGMVIELIKNVLYTLLKGSSSAMIGEFANLTIGAVWVFVAGYLYNRNRTFKSAIMSLILSGVAMTVSAVLLNYFVLLPMYTNVFKVDLGGSIGKFILVATIPFNLLKGAITSFATMLLYKPVIAVITRQSIKSVKY